MTETQDQPRTHASFTAAACLFHGFSDPVRLAILQRLSEGDQRVVDLVNHLGMPQSSCSKHLACLKDCGLVTSRAQGRASVYSLTHPELVRRLFAAADDLLEATGEAVALCANYGATTLHQIATPTEETS
ncbi:metalloregulator ArsR/SmtB family transcription factor [Microbacterium sp. ARD31]|uniref:ArsR/SmtB family transcription factor n=1 Tax=Microbacterium sp. ARD31 TaxID=2962576 RepID=UPI002880E3C2|nr:metalloregulator ArsR/SmtB family transcription factor [Microbacterium sp. ARD31]MDT0187913.1 metalloregulator ArsR/SmtB family transcription factor [Microbacterium sp. ARD31]